MPHDEHFLTRLDRVSDSGDDLELALALYRDHELVRFVLDHARLAEGAERVAIALTADPHGPHIIVARDGGFVTCLAAGMKTGSHPVVGRAQLDGLAAKHERVREGLALARRRGGDLKALLSKMSSVASAYPREDFIAARALAEPTAGSLIWRWLRWMEQTDQMLTLLLPARVPGDARKYGNMAVARGSWGMANIMLLLADSAPREFVEMWSSEPELHWAERSMWTGHWKLGAVPFAARAAWTVARFGKPLLPSYKARYSRPVDEYELREAGWGLVTMGLRHQGLRAEIWRALAGRKPGAGEEPWVGPQVERFARVARLLEDSEESLRAEALDAARGAAVAASVALPAGSPFRYEDRAQVPDDIALPYALSAWHPLEPEREPAEGAGADRLLLAIVAAAKARGEDFFLPAQLLYAMGPPDQEQLGAAVVDLVRAIRGAPKPVAKGEAAGRNEPCPCGSGKKYKKCHGR